MAERTTRRKKSAARKAGARDEAAESSSTEPAPVRRAGSRTGGGDGARGRDAAGRGGSGEPGDDAQPVEVEVLAPGEAPAGDDEIEDLADDDLALQMLDVAGAPIGDEELDADDDETLAVAVDSDARTRLIKNDPLTAYVQETRRYRVLSREEEHELAVRYREHGDLGAARRLIESNLRLVVKIAYEYRRAHRNLLDLVQEGNIGLMQAVQKYDPYRGVKLSSYAAWWIRAYILKFVLNNWRLVKIGTTQAQRKLFFNLRKERERLEQLGFHPEPKLLAERLEVSEKDVIEMEKRLAAPDTSLDAPVGGEEGDGTRTRLDYLEGQASSRPDVQAEQAQFHALLREKLVAFGETLKGREQTIFRERLLTDSPLTLQEIGDRYGVSRERARQIEKRLRDRLRAYLEAELGTVVEIGAFGRD
jgi:RNA polymerase sigma-32 factor